MPALALFALPLVQGGHLPPPATDADFFQHAPAKVELGRMLFFDKELSGNRNTSCATCHHSLTATGDGLSLPVGEGGTGLGVTRDCGVVGSTLVPERVPRNAPHVFNLGAKEFVRMFHDGRVEADPTTPSGFLSPAGNELPLGLDSALAAQAMFPVTSGTEMAGQKGENTVANAADVGNLAGSGGVWEQLAGRLQLIPEYFELFRDAYPGEVVIPGDITFVHAANAIAAFEGTAWRATNSRFDRFLAGEHTVLSPNERRGMRLFYGKAGCVQCHAGTFQTDQEFHSVAMPQIGPGKGDGPMGYEDYGRERVTGDVNDRYRFRTPTLRNVALTGPWGHAGAYNTLEAVVRHQLDPLQGLMTYDQEQTVLPSHPTLDPFDFMATNDPFVTTAIARTNEREPVALSDSEVEVLLDFLHTLTDPDSLDLRADTPMRVPSGLPLAE
jgi:cytochrome c peroxidase